MTEHLVKNITKILDKAFAIYTKQLVEGYVSEGLRASGQWGRTVSHTVLPFDDQIGAFIEALPYTWQMIGGTPPLNLQGSQFATFVDTIHKWARDKKVGPTDAKGLESFAYLVARKINDGGSKRYRTNTPATFFADTISEEAFAETISNVAEEAAVTFATHARSAYRNLATNVDNIAQPSRVTSG